MTAKQVLKSKTIDFNVLVPAVTALLTALGVTVAPQVVVSVLVLGNIVLRLITKGSVSAK